MHEKKSKFDTSKWIIAVMEPLYRICRISQFQNFRVTHDGSSNENNSNKCRVILLSRQFRSKSF